MRTNQRADYCQIASAIVEENMKMGNTHESALPFYQTMIETANGYQHTGHPNSRKALHVMFKRITPALIQEHLEADGACSRFDLAIDTPSDIIRAYISEPAITSTMLDTGAVKMITDGRGRVETIYIGDRKRRRRNGIIRIYDKARQTGSDSAWYRLEVEAGRNRAHRVAEMFADGIPPGQIIRWMIQSQADWFQMLTAHEYTPFSPPAPPTPPTTSELERKKKWVMKQVLPSLRYIDEQDPSFTAHLCDLIKQGRR